MKLFQELGMLVEHKWRESGYEHALFPEIAAQALREIDVVSRTDPWEIIRWVHSTSSLPPQQDREGRFGDPPITLFCGPGFYIDAYYWLDGTTSIHQHGFCGAFQVLHGSSVHCHYRFEMEREINPHFLVGRIRLQEVSLLCKRDIRKILSGREFIHSLFHLERPSATIVIRSHDAPRDPIQYNYLKPSLAVDPLQEDDSLSKKIQTVSLLLSMKHPEADSFIKKLLEESDFQTTHAVLDVAFGFLGGNQLEKLFQLSKSSDRFQEMLETARARHQAMADLLPAVFEAQQCQREIIRRRRMVEGEGHRFFLALLLNVPDRVMVLDLIKQKFPGSDPVEIALAWIKELTSIRIFGSPEANVLGLNSFHASHLAVFAGMLSGLSDEEIDVSTHNQLPPGSTFAEVATDIRNSPFFKSIFGSQV